MPRPGHDMTFVADIPFHRVIIRITPYQDPLDSTFLNSPGENSRTPTILGK